MITASLLRDYVAMLLVRMRAPHAVAQTVAAVLVEADLRGAHSQGVDRIRDYYYLILAGRLRPDALPQLVYQTPSTATVDGNASFGPAVAQHAMAVAIEKAANAGTGWVAVRNSHHFGMGAYYAMMALELDMVGVVMSNGPAMVAPVYGSSRMLGANPVAMAIPTQRHPALVIDLSTSVLSEEHMLGMRDGQITVPNGLLQDAIGHPSTDLGTLSRGGALLPLGGDLEHGSHKGFCLGAMVDIFSSLFGGACYGPFVPPQNAYTPHEQTGSGSGIGHFLGAIRADAFRPLKEFKAAADEWIDTFRYAKGIGGMPAVMLPGDSERSIREGRLKKGIPLGSHTLKSINQVAKSLDCPPVPYQPDAE